MQPRLIRVLISTVSSIILLFVLACGATSISEVASPDVVRCATSLGAAIPTVPAAGAQVPVTVTAARECSWTAASDSSWMQVSPASGQGQATITLTIGSNGVADSRTATLTINSDHFSVVQAAAPCQFSLASTAGQIGNTGGSLAVHLSATARCTWTAVAHDDWVHVQTASGSGDATIGLVIDRNTGPARSSGVTIAGLTFTVSQDAYAPPAPTPGPPPPPPSPTPAPSPTPSPSCTYTLSSYQKNFDDKGGGGDFKVITPDGCTWSASTSADWISIVSGTSDAGSDVKYQVDRNPSTAPRIGTISVADQVYTVTQKGH